MSGTPIAELLFEPSDATPFSTHPSTVKPWRDAERCLRASPKGLLSTVRPDGRPHVAPVMLVLVADRPHFATRPGSVKGANLRRTAHCILALSDPELDLVVEGDATRIEQVAELLAVAAAFKARFGWTFEVTDSGIVRDAELPGAPEYDFYGVEPRRAYGYGGDGLTATRWRFAS